MGHYDEPQSLFAEDIQGAPPAVPESELRQQRLSETLTLNRYLYEQLQELELKLLAATDLQALLEVMLVALPRQFSFPACELWLHDPEALLQSLLVSRHRYGRNLQLLQDAFELQELYGERPEVALIDATDERMFQLLKSASGVSHALLIPLREGERLIGSLHCGIEDPQLWQGAAAAELVPRLAAILSVCFHNGVSRQRLAQLSLVDPETEVGNRRAFEIETLREIARARRDKAPLCLLLLQVDEYDDLVLYHGKSSSEYVLRKIAERISGDLRTTDRLSRLADDCLAALLPGTGEVRGQDIAERMREQLEVLPVDDGRGAVMHTTISVGLTAWDSGRYPAVDLGQLARQFEGAARKGLLRAVSAGGNRVMVSRLSALLT